MNRSFLVREWGAATFVLTVLVGVVVVPIALVVGNKPTAPPALPATPTPTVSATASPSASPSPVASPTPSPSPST